MTIRLHRLDARQAPSLHSAQDLEHTSSLERTPRTRAWVSCLAFPPSRCAVQPSSPWSAHDPPCPVLRRRSGRGARAGSSAVRLWRSWPRPRPLAPAPPAPLRATAPPPVVRGARCGRRLPAGRLMRGAVPGHGDRLWRGGTPGPCRRMTLPSAETDDRAARWRMQVCRRHGEHVRLVRWWSGRVLTQAASLWGPPHGCRSTRHKSVWAGDGYTGRGQTCARQACGLEGPRDVDRTREAQRTPDTRPLAWAAPALPVGPWSLPRRGRRCRENLAELQPVR